MVPRREGKKTHGNLELSALWVELGLIRSVDSEKLE